MSFLTEGAVRWLAAISATYSLNDLSRPPRHQPAHPDESARVGPASRAPLKGPYIDRSKIATVLLGQRGDIRGMAAANLATDDEFETVVEHDPQGYRLASYPQSVIHSGSIKPPDIAANSG